jgi:hypothetical protein
MSAREIIDELPKLTEAERAAVLEKLRELRRQQFDGDSIGVDLRARGIGERQAAELRSRLKAFSEDWERPEAAIYDEDPAR